MVAQYIPARFGIPLGVVVALVAAWKIGIIGWPLSWQPWVVIVLLGLVVWRIWRVWKNGRNKKGAQSEALSQTSKGIEELETSIQIDAIIQELESKIIHRMAYSDKVFSMLEIFDALRDNFALGLSYPQVHGVLRDKLNRDTVWGIYSSDILATLITMGLIHAPTIDPSSSVFLDNKYTIPQYVYELTDKGKILAHKLMSQKPKTDKEGSQT